MPGMPQTATLVDWLWTAFLLCWLVLARFNKRSSRSTPWRRHAWALRLAIIGGLLLVLSVRQHGGTLLAASIGRWLPDAALPAQWLGVGLCLAGFGLAFWARAHLGRNWGIPMSLREEHELVTSGPYAHVRHPIYTGILLAMFGSALAVGFFWLALFALALVYFFLSARTEEQMMLAQFPDTYPAYRHRTRMLIPLLL